MSTETKDLDLIALRARLRGWAIPDEDNHGDEFVIITPGGEVTVTHGWPISEWSSSARPYANILTAPRLTLADIIADPGEGWRVVRQIWTDAFTGFGWSSDKGLHAVVDVDDRGEVMKDPWYCTGISKSERIAAHRAVTDLLIKLAEVE